MHYPKKLIDKRSVLLPLVCIRNPEAPNVSLSCCAMSFEADAIQEDSRRIRENVQPEFKFFSTIHC